MKTITLMVMVDGNEVVRNYSLLSANDTVEMWGDRVVDMLETLAKSNEEKF